MGLMGTCGVSESILNIGIRRAGLNRPRPRRMDRRVATHRDRILDQFTRQAAPFSTAPGIRDAAALQRLVDASGAGADDVVLDVACGPGLVVCAFAAVARHVTGIDVTPAMLDRARTLAAEHGLANVTWRQGEVLPLPFDAASFSIVVSRFAFHHFERPEAVLAEMRRVCRPGGRVVVYDLLSSDDPAKADAFHRLEMLRDPSHVRALRRDELAALFPAVGLPMPAITDGTLPFVVEEVICRSFPRPEDLPAIRATYAGSVDGDTLGLGTHRAGDELRAAYPTAIFTAVR
jgi:ubiquinone/menaquinone biosynthesis C-methylase UbiE